MPTTRPDWIDDRVRDDVVGLCRRVVGRVGRARELYVVHRFVIQGTIDRWKRLVGHHGVPASGSDSDEGRLQRQWFLLEQLVEAVGVEAFVCEDEALELDGLARFDSSLRDLYLGLMCRELGDLRDMMSSPPFNMLKPGLRVLPLDRFPLVRIDGGTYVSSMHLLAKALPLCHRLLLAGRVWEAVQRSEGRSSGGVPAIGPR